MFSPHDPGTLYAGGNCVFRTRNQGMSWQRISPDLSLNERSRQGASGGQITIMLEEGRRSSVDSAAYRDAEGAHHYHQCCGGICSTPL